MNTPSITVLMPAYNTERYVAEAIESVLGQTLGDYEFLIINDGSTDRTLEIIERYHDERIRVISRPNKGLIATLNEGLAEARAPVIARMDADDICLPHRLQREYEFLLAHTDLAMVGSDVEYVDEFGNYVAYQKAPDGHSYDEIMAARFYKCPFFHPTVMFRKEAIIAAGGYPEGAIFFEDWLLWIRLMDCAPVQNLKEALLRMRINPESVTIDEKWRGPRYAALQQKALRDGSITQEATEEMMRIIKSQSSHTYKAASYHAFIAKKYLWDNPQPQIARKHLREVIKCQPGHKEPYLLYMASFLPTAWLQKIYRSVKARQKPNPTAA